jgi:prepilin-type N-terminal cleavage/methylation domain-containing protein
LSYPTAAERKKFEEAGLGSKKRNHPPGKPGAFVRLGDPCGSKKRNHPPGKPGALGVLPRRAAPIRNPKSKIQNPKSAFTLVELLVTITIITMLAGLVLGGLSMARTSAREMKTKATIAKLDEIIMRMYAGYANRRVPIDTSGMPPRIAAEMRLKALRQLMRFEMPERWSDVPDSSTAPQFITIKDDSGTFSREMPMPAVSYMYSAVKNAATVPGNVGYNSHAECLYLIISIAAPRELANFSADEIGDTDGDGLPEFLDAWGNPIYFLRWAPGFSESDIQPPPGIVTTDSRFVHDPFDAQNLYASAWKLTPLIFSAGPSGRVDLNDGGLINHGLEMGQD